MHINIEDNWDSVIKKDQTGFYRCGTLLTFLCVSSMRMVSYSSMQYASHCPANKRDPTFP